MRQGIETILDTHWLWPVLTLVLASLWIWTAVRLRRAASEGPPVADRRTHEPMEAEDALKAAYALQEKGNAWHGEKLAQSMGLPKAMGQDITRAFVASGWAQVGVEGALRLTEAGKARARELVRAHRLWEQYLVKQEGMPLEAVHSEAHRREHEMSAEEVERLDEALGHPAWDPHGHAIPGPGSPVPFSEARSLLAEGVPDSRLRIASLDDEPAALLAQLLALGLRPGVDIEVLDQEGGVLRLRLDGEPVPLAFDAAEHISVVPTPILPVPMAELPIGSQARVVDIAGTGRHQRRMLDMGFVPGAEVSTVRKAPLGDPIEYRIKGTAVALRHEDAATVLVEELGYE